MAEVYALGFVSLSCVGNALVHLQSLQSLQFTE